MKTIKYLIIKNNKIESFDKDFKIKKYKVDGETLIVDSSLEEIAEISLSEFFFKIKTIHIINSEINHFSSVFIHDLKFLTVEDSVCSFEGLKNNHISVFNFVRSNIKIKNLNMSKLYIYATNSEVFIENSKTETLFLYLKEGSIFDAVSFVFKQIFKDIKESKIIRI